MTKKQYTLETLRIADQFQMIFSDLYFPFLTNEWLSQNSQELDLSIWSKVSLVQPIEGECFVSDVKARRGVCQSEGALFKAPTQQSHGSHDIWYIISRIY